LLPPGGDIGLRFDQPDDGVDRADEIGANGTGALSRPIEFGHRGSVVGQISPIAMYTDREFDDRLAHVLEVKAEAETFGDQANQSVEVRSETTGKHLASRLLFDLGEAPIVTGEFAPQACERSFGGGIERGMLTHPDVFVPGGAVDRP
jgi:hypothetical protein